MENNEFMKKTIHYGLVLTLVCTVAAVALGFIFKTAKPKIDQRAEEQTKRDLKDLFTEKDIEFTQPSGDDSPYWEARQAGNLIGYVVKGEAKGYSSTIKLLVRTDPEIKNIIRIKVGSSQETPGLGERIKETKSTNTIIGSLAGTNKTEEGLRPWFQESFDNLPVDRLVVVKDGGDGVEAISGATISSTAVVEAVKNGIVKLKNTIGDNS